MQPPKNKAWTSPTLNLSPQTNPHSETVDASAPPTHSHEPGSNRHTVLAAWSQPEPATHLHSGSRSAKIMTIVWNASRAHARLVSTKCLICHLPNSPQYLWSISSMHSFSGPGSFAAGGMSGDRSSGSGGKLVSTLDDVVGILRTSKKLVWVCY